VSSNNHETIAEQKDFWDGLQKDIIASNQSSTQEDDQYFIERSFMLSSFFRGCTPNEIIYYQNKLKLKEYGYLIIVELQETTTSFSIDEIQLHQTVKNILHKKACAVSLLITGRLGILITEDYLLTDIEQREDSLGLCQELAKGIEKEFHLDIIAGIGIMQNMHSIYSSFTSALSCFYYKETDTYIYHQDIKRDEMDPHFDYMVTETHLIEAIRLRKADAYDYFGLLMEWVKPLNDSMKRNKILEILILTNHAMCQDSQNDSKPLDHMSIVADLMNLSGNQIIEYAYQLFIYLTNFDKPQSTIDYSNHIVKATREYLENHYSEDISLEDMAEYVNISPQYFSKLIKKTTGFNFIDWLSMLRVKKAKELLTNSNLTVKEVCFMVGYKDPNYFSRIFKKRIGITPSEYVKANSYLNNKN
jgi:two-component system, response regulator YesN